MILKLQIQFIFQAFVACVDYLHIKGKEHEKKKAWIMDCDQTEEFMNGAPNSNCYWLVRKVFVAINLYGGLRGYEMKGILSSQLPKDMKSLTLSLKIGRRRNKRSKYFYSN
jgi:hypothetical protein